MLGFLNPSISLHWENVDFYRKSVAEGILGSQDHSPRPVSLPDTIFVSTFGFPFALT